MIWSDRGRPDWIAADLIAQAEHDPAARAILVTTRGCARARGVARSRTSDARDRTGAASRSRRNGALVVAASRRTAAAIVNDLAPEHLVVDTVADANVVRTAGTMFVGPWSAQAAGDYGTGSNHVLPTGGAGRFRGGLSAADFVRVFTVQTLTRAGIRRIGRRSSRWRRPKAWRRTRNRCGCGCDELPIGVADRLAAPALQREHRRLFAGRARGHSADRRGKTSGHYPDVTGITERIEQWFGVSRGWAQITNGLDEGIQW